MKTRSGVMRMPPHWPSLYKAREHIPELQTFNQFRKTFNRFLDAAIYNEQLLYNRRLLVLVISEMTLKYQLFLDDKRGQYLLDKIIKTLVTVPYLKEYTQQFKVLSDSHRLKAKQDYIEFIFTGVLCKDVGRHIANFV